MVKTRYYHDKNRYTTLWLLDELKSSSRWVKVENALDRNLILTSVRTLSLAEVYVYHEGFYLVLNGTRCRVATFFRDDDGELTICRKPHDNKLHLIWYDNSVMMDEDDYR